MRVGIVGASGYTGAELLRLAAGHPEMEVVLATGDTQAGTAVADLYPSLRPVYGDLVFEPYSPDVVDGLDIVFCGLPHGASQAIVPEVKDRVKWVLDLSADFRLKDPAAYPRWYGAEHTAPELLDDFAYGLPELFRDELVGAAGVAVPGCYPTAASLALAPLVRGGAVESSGIVVDAASGVSGAGRALDHGTQFCTVDEDFAAYGLLDHRHTPEMEQVLGAQVLFTPHLAPMTRGILATCYARPSSPTTTDEVLGLLRDAYADEPFVTVIDGPPTTKAVLGSNSALVTARADERTGWVLALCAIDNLVKGASGQAVQCANIVAGLPEPLGLPLVGMYP
ncbi:MAG TPA: N-acetyl-gamma-glutamyl-phosphate reductase [Acidimicrobiales bacterium]